MEDALLHVVTAQLREPSDPDDALLFLRRCCSVSGDHCFTLLFCDWADACAQHLPEDESILRRLQSGVMALNARTKARFALLVRRRAYSKAKGRYVGASQEASVRSVFAALLQGDEPPAAFDAATVAPGSLKSRFAAVLFSDIALVCTPDTPQRLFSALSASGYSCLCAQVLPRRVWPQSALARLGAFSLDAREEAEENRLSRRGLARADRHPAIFTVSALTGGRIPETAPLAKGCFFVRCDAPTLSGCLHQYHAHCLRVLSADALLQPLRTALLFLSAASGQPLLSLAALAEFPALANPRRLPAALLRVVLLPAASFLSLHAALARQLERTKHARLLPPDFRLAPAVCALAGAALLPPALHTAHALVPSLFVGLLWLAAPLILPALDKPTIERIPLSGDQAAELRHLAEDAFFAAQPSPASARHILAVCAGSMLGLLETDEAARRAETLLDMLDTESTRSAVDHASLLASAQYLREHMASCDAALRELPARLESFALRSPQDGGGKLGALLCAARCKESSPDALRAIRCAAPQDPLEHLFLPCGPTRETPQHPLTLSLTHPHTFLARRNLLQDGSPPADEDAAGWFLSLSAAALGHPFFALLLRSPVCGPYMPLLSL